MKLERYKDKKETRKKVVLISLTVVTIVSVAMMLYKTFAKFTTSTSFTIMSGKVKYKPKGKDLTEIPTVSQGDGLYSVSHSGASGDWSKSELRYAGSNPNNYVYFNCNNGEEEDSTNCELWRIIGLVNVKTNENTFEQRLKIIRKDLIGSYTFDYHGAGNYSSDWTRATLMGLLNSTYYNSLNANTYCYRGSYQSTCDFSATGSQKGLTSKAKGMIDSTVIWPLGGSTTAEVTAETMYGYERGGLVYGATVSVK